MGGIGQRFRKENYRFPKPLIKIVGRPMLFWLLDNLDTKEEDVIYIGILEDVQKQFDIIQTLKIEYPKRVFQGISLGFETRGTAETLFIMLQSVAKDRLQRKTISLDCDTIYFKPVIEEFRRLSDNLNASFYFEDNGSKPIYSYLKFKDNMMPEGYSVVSEVREKIMISSHANTGAYAFRSAFVLKKYCMKVLDEAVGESGEYYTTNIIKLMIDNEELFVGIPVNTNDFVCVGTPEQLTQFLTRLKDRQNQIDFRKIRFCFDLDNTLVSYPTKYGDYSSVQPKVENIQLVRELHSAGHYIIIQTARRMKTHKGNVGAVIADIGKLTLDTLTKFDIPYDELHFGKPHADVYIDDSAIHALIDTTKEIGWSLDDTEYNFRDRKRVKGFMFTRHFHTVQQLDDLIIKSSATENLLGEIYFYQNIPQQILDLFPKLDRIENNKQAGISSIVIEKVNGITYSHLFTSLCLTEGRLVKFLSSLKRIHSALPKESIEVKCNIYENYSKKIFLRYNQYRDIYKTLDEYFKEYSEPSMISSADFVDYFTNYFVEYERLQRGQHNPVIHGDPVFSNALLTHDSRVVFLDMRGSLGAELSLQGDLNYDFAKIYQSLTGYDFVVLNKADVLSMSNVEAYLSQLVEAFYGFISREYSHYPKLIDLKMITAQLYFSLIPLHDNFEHQILFYKIATKLYRNFVSNL